MNYNEYIEKIGELQSIPTSNIILYLLADFRYIALLPRDEKEFNDIRERYFVLLNVLVDILNYSKFGKNTFDTFNYTEVRDEIVKKLLEKKGELCNMDDLTNRLYE